MHPMNFVSSMSFQIQQIQLLPDNLYQCKFEFINYSTYTIYVHYQKINKNICTSFRTGRKAMLSTNFEASTNTFSFYPTYIVLSCNLQPTLQTLVV